MPSAFAHAAVGATLATALPTAARPRLFVSTLAVLAAAPDLDVVFHTLGVAYHEPLGHRGFTHSIFFAVFVGATSVPIWRRWGAKRSALAGVLTGAAVLSHGLLDLFTDAGLGIGLLLPFDETRFFAPFRPIMTSPLSVSAFFQGRGLTILANEAFWIGPPTLVLALLARAVRDDWRRAPTVHDGRDALGGTRGPARGRRRGSSGTIDRPSRGRDRSTGESTHGVDRWPR